MLRARSFTFPASSVAIGKMRSPFSIGTRERSLSTCSTVEKVLASPATISVELLGSVSISTCTGCLPGWAGSLSTPLLDIAVSVRATASRLGPWILNVRSCAAGGSSTRSSFAASSCRLSMRSEGASKISELLPASAETETSFGCFSHGCGRPSLSVGVGGSG